MAVLEYPVLLLGASQPDPDHVRGGAVDHFHNVVVLFTAQWSKGRRIHASDLHAWSLLLEFLGHLFRYTLSAAVKEMAVSPIMCSGTECRHKIWAGNATRVPKSVYSAHPCQRHAIRQAEIHRGHYFSEFGVPFRLHDVIHIGKRHKQTSPSLRNRMFDQLDCRGHGQSIHP